MKHCEVLSDSYNNSNIVTATKLYCEGVPSNQINWSITPHDITPDLHLLQFSPQTLTALVFGNNGCSANIANPTEVGVVQSPVSSAVYHDEIYILVWGGLCVTTGREGASCFLDKYLDFGD